MISFSCSVVVLSFAKQHSVKNQQSSWIFSTLFIITTFNFSPLLSHLKSIFVDSKEMANRVRVETKDYASHEPPLSTLVGCGIWKKVLRCLCLFDDNSNESRFATGRTDFQFEKLESICWRSQKRKQKVLAEEAETFISILCITQCIPSIVSSTCSYKEDCSHFIIISRLLCYTPIGCSIFHTNAALNLSFRAISCYWHLEELYCAAFLPYTTTKRSELYIWPLCWT